MGASEILEILRKGGEFTSFEISEQSDCSVASVKQSMRRLLKDISENVEFRKLTPEEKAERYGHKISCNVRIYWLNE